MKGWTGNDFEITRLDFKIHFYLQFDAADKKQILGGTFHNPELWSHTTNKLGYGHQVQKKKKSHILSVLVLGIFLDQFP